MMNRVRLKEGSMAKERYGNSQRYYAEKINGDYTTLVYLLPGDKKLTRICVHTVEVEGLNTVYP